jgi:hypothetical protein
VFKKRKERKTEEVQAGWLVAAGSVSVSPDAKEKPFLDFVNRRIRGSVVLLRASRK